MPQVSGYDGLIVVATVYFVLSMIAPQPGCPRCGVAAWGGGGDPLFWRRVAQGLGILAALVIMLLSIGNEYVNWLLLALLVFGPWAPILISINADRTVDSLGAYIQRIHEMTPWVRVLQSQNAVLCYALAFVVGFSILLYWVMGPDGVLFGGALGITVIALTCVTQLYRHTLNATNLFFNQQPYATALTGITPAQAAQLQPVARVRGAPGPVVCGPVPGSASLHPQPQAPRARNTIPGDVSYPHSPAHVHDRPEAKQRSVPVSVSRAAGPATTHSSSTTGPSQSEYDTSFDAEYTDPAGDAPEDMQETAGLPGPREYDEPSAPSSGEPGRAGGEATPRPWQPRSVDPYYPSHPAGEQKVREEMHLPYTGRGGPVTVQDTLPFQDTGSSYVPTPYTGTMGSHRQGTRPAVPWSAGPQTARTPARVPIQAQGVVPRAVSTRGAAMDHVYRGQGSPGSTVRPGQAGSSTQASVGQTYAGAPRAHGSRVLPGPFVAQGNMHRGAPGAAHRVYRGTPAPRTQTPTSPSGYTDGASGLRAWGQPAQVLMLLPWQSRAPPMQRPQDTIHIEQES